MKYRILPILADLIPTTLLAYEGILFDALACCPHCGGDITDYDIRKKQFAVITDGRTQKTITVRVKRFKCTECHAVVYARQPFYPGTRIGSPVVDLCITFASMMPYARASAYLQRAGIVVDRWSVRNYAQRDLTIATTMIYGTRLPDSIVNLAELASHTGEGHSIDSFDIISACDYPSLKLTGTHQRVKEKKKPGIRDTPTLHVTLIFLWIILIDCESFLQYVMVWGSLNLIDLPVFT
jgi:hypothetical protein